MKLHTLEQPISEIIPLDDPIEEVFTKTKDNSLRLRDMFSRRRTTLSEALLAEASPHGTTLIRAKSERGWIHYKDGGRDRYLQVLDVANIPGTGLRWAVTGQNERLKQVRTFYDLVPDREFSQNFNQASQLGFGEVIKLVRKGVITDNGNQIKNLGGLKKVADKAGIKLIEEKEDENVFNDGLPIEQVEAQLFSPMESSAQRRRVGRPPWGTK